MNSICLRTLYSILLYFFRFHFPITNLQIPASVLKSKNVPHYLHNRKNKSQNPPYLNHNLHNLCLYKKYHTQRVCFMNILCPFLTTCMKYFTQNVLPSFRSLLKNCLSFGSHFKSLHLQYLLMQLSETEILSDCVALLILCIAVLITYCPMARIQYRSCI